MIRKGIYMEIFGTVFFEDFQKYITPIIYIVIGFLSYQILKIIIRSFLNKKTMKKRHHQKRAETISTLILNIIKYLIAVFVILGIMSNFGLDIKALIAGLGIFSAIAALAFQDIAKDFLAGITIIGEDQYEIGDTIEINGFLGEVIFIGLRSTRIRDYKGATMIINNHNITSVINYNLHPSLAEVDVPISREEDPEKVEKVFQTLSKELKGKISKAKGDLEILGVNNITDQAMVYRLVMKVAATEQYQIQRILLKEIRNALEKNHIKVPKQKIEVTDGK